MSSITTQQTKLDLELVPKENRLDIGKRNGRIPHGFSPREPTFQVTLDALALTPCYPAFLITVDVPEVYMHQFWNCIYKHDDFYRFKIVKNKCFKLTLEVSRDILQICPRVQGRDFDPFPSEEDTMSFLRDLGHTGERPSGLDKLRLSRAQILWGMYHQKSIHVLWVAVHTECLTSPEMKESKAYKTYLGYATGEVPPKGKRLKTHAKKSASKPATCIVIREPPVETKSKIKEKEKVDVAYGKGIELLSEVALSEKAQMKENPPRVKSSHLLSKVKETGEKPGVPDVTNDDSFESESEFLTISTSQDTSQAGSSSTTISHAKEARRIAEKAVVVADMDERVNRAVTAANRAANAAIVVAIKAVQNRMHDRPLEIFSDPCVFIWENGISLEVQGGGAALNHNEVRISKRTD
ncbi:hypothetical protein Tco_0356596 [Tanacetum coccineum]